MGLLDDLLGQLENAQAAPTRRPEAASASGASGMAPLLTALLPVALAMLGGNDKQSRGGGLAGLLGQVLGGGTTTRQGGLGALLGQLEQAGFGDQVRSWVGTGQNVPIPADAIARLFGDGGLAEIARRAGVSQPDAARGLSELMPELVDRMTPNGRMPDDDDLLANVDALAKRFGLA